MAMAGLQCFSDGSARGGQYHDNNCARAVLHHFDRTRFFRADVIPGGLVPEARLAGFVNALADAGADHFVKWLKKRLYIPMIW